MCHRCHTAHRPRQIFPFLTIFALHKVSIELTQRFLGVHVLKVDSVMKIMLGF